MTFKMRTVKTELIALAVAAVVLLPLATFAANGSATPEKAFDNFKTGMKNKDFKTSFSQLTPEGQDMMLSGVAVAMSLGLGMDPAKAEEAHKLTEKHGIKKVDLTKLQPGQDPRPIVREAISDVKDKPACFSELMTWMENNSPSKDKTQRMEEYGNATLTDLKTEGDTASGMVKMKHEGQDTSSAMNFKKIGGMWYIDLGGGAPQGGAQHGSASPGEGGK